MNVKIASLAVVTIPVVVHVVWNSPAENISEVQILSQLEVLNQDFKAENDEIADSFFHCANGPQEYLEGIVYHFVNALKPLGINLPTDDD